MVISKILLIRLRELGDTILVSPLLRQLKRIYPSVKVDVLCQKNNQSLLTHSRHVDKTIVFPRGASASHFLKTAAQLRKQKYDLIIDAQGLPKTAMLSRLIGGKQRVGFYNRGWRNRICYTNPVARPVGEYHAKANLRLIPDSRVDLSDTSLECEVGEDAKDSATQFARKYFVSPVAAIFGVDRYSYRCWPAGKTAVIADRLAELGFQPWLVYGPGQEQDSQRIASLMKRESLWFYEMPSFATLAALFRHCRVCVGNDGGPMHAARAAGIPTVTVYNYEFAMSWAPVFDQKHRVVCTQGPPVIGSNVMITDSTSLEDIQVDEVWKAVGQVLY